jgi:hypothetical protein
MLPKPKTTYLQELFRSSTLRNGCSTVNDGIYTFKSFRELVSRDIRDSDCLESGAVSDVAGLEFVDLGSAGSTSKLDCSQFEGSSCTERIRLTLEHYILSRGVERRYESLTTQRLQLPGGKLSVDM